jgi:predicted cupin superfamily sugar epimerase
MSTTAEADYWIDTLSLVPHPEGGHYRETYRSSELIDCDCLPERYHRSRAMATAIHFLLRAGERSKLHRLASDEIWHFHSGAALRLSIIAPDGTLDVVSLGGDAATGERFQHVVAAGSWFGAEIVAGGAYCLVSCTVAPGFDFADFEMARREDLVERFPAHRSTIERLTDE